MYWIRDDKPSADRVNLLASGLVLQGRQLGTGSKVFAAKFDLMNADEKRGEAMAVSAWRKCIFLSEYLWHVS